MKSFPVFFGWFFPFSKEHSLFYGIFLKLLIPGFFSWGILLLYALSLFSPHSFVLSFFFFFVIEILTEEFIYIWGSALIGSSIYVAGVKLLSFLPSSLLLLLLPLFFSSPFSHFWRIVNSWYQEVFFEDKFLRATIPQFLASVMPGRWHLGVKKGREENVLSTIQTVDFNLVFFFLGCFILAFCYAWCF